ncbi:MAG: TIGR01458 family HAD-type hydrolase [Verrucomicrobiota bacterium]
MASPIPSFKGLLLDLDGTLYVGDSPLPGAVDALNRIHSAGTPVRFLTNTTSKPRSAIIAHARDLGLSIDPRHLYTPPMVARDLLLAAGRTRCHCLLTPEVIADIEGIEQVDENPDAVVLGDMGNLFTIDRLDRALRFLLDGVPFYTLARNRCFRAGSGLRLDVGAYAVALEFGSRREAVLLGKPAVHFFKAALNDMALAPEDVIMVGDDIEGDVAGAQNAGIRGVLVRTGKFRESDLQRGITPDAVLASFATLVAPAR